MKNPYQNEHLKARVKENMFAMRFIIIMELLGLFLCFLSFFNAYKELYTHNEIRFTDLLGLADDTIYTIEINEMPEELYPSYYMVKMGDNALLVTGIDDELEQFKRNGGVNVRGQLRGFLDSEQDIRQSAWNYFSRNSYYTDNFKIKERAAGHYLECSDYSYKKILLNDHPLGMVFGLTVLIINSLIMYWQGTLYVIRHLHPACGSVRYTPQEIDEQADLPESQWDERTGIYFTPEILIGTQKGMTAVRYDDIEKIYIRKRWHINWASSPSRSRLKNDSKKNAEIMIWAASKNSEYYSYQLIAVSKNHRKLIICDCTYIDPSITDRIREKCGPEVEADFSCQ